MRFWSKIWSRRGPGNVEVRHATAQRPVKSVTPLQGSPFKLVVGSRGVEFEGFRAPFGTRFLTITSPGDPYVAVWGYCAGPYSQQAGVNILRSLRGGSGQVPFTKSMLPAGKKDSSFFFVVTGGNPYRKKCSRLFLFRKREEGYLPQKGL